MWMEADTQQQNVSNITFKCVGIGSFSSSESEIAQASLMHHTIEAPQTPDFHEKMVFYNKSFYSKKRKAGMLFRESRNFLNHKKEASLLSLGSNPSKAHFPYRRRHIRGKGPAQVLPGSMQCMKDDPHSMLVLQIRVNKGHFV